MAADITHLFTPSTAGVAGAVATKTHSSEDAKGELLKSSHYATNPPVINIAPLPSIVPALAPVYVNAFEVVCDNDRLNFIH